MQLVLLTVLYWWSAVNLKYIQTMDKKNIFLTLLKYVPSILMIFSYMIIYFALEHLFVSSRM